jgi:hypothetical protein
VAVGIYGEHSCEGVYARCEVVATLGGEEQTFHEIKRLQNANLMPRKGSASRPLTMYCLNLARENERLGYRHWLWMDLQGQPAREATGYEFFQGYGFYATDGTFIFIDTYGKEIAHVGTGVK